MLPAFPELIFLELTLGSLLVASFHFIVFSLQGSLTAATLNSLKFPSTQYYLKDLSQYYPCFPASQDRYLHDMQLCGRWL